MVANTELRVCPNCLRKCVCKHSPAMEQYIAAEKKGAPFKAEKIAEICDYFMNQNTVLNMAEVVKVEEMEDLGDPRHEEPLPAESTGALPANQ